MRQTKKLTKAQAAIAKLGLTKKFATAQTAISGTGQDAIYELLQKNNYFWNSQTQEWEKAQPPDPPSQVIKIRITTDGNWLENSDLLSRIERAMDAIRLKQADKSKLYPQRPPNQSDSAIYYQFIDELKP